MDDSVTLTGIPIRQHALGRRLQQALLNENVLKASFRLKESQQETALASANALMEGQGSGLFVRPARTGKTIIFGGISKALDERTLILVPKKDLAGQTKEKLVDVVGFSPKDIGVIHSDVTEAERAQALQSKVLITTYDSFRTLMKNGSVRGNEFPYVVLDEVHHAGGEETCPLIKEILRQGAVVQGWTATDIFADGGNISDLLFNGAPPIDQQYFYECVKQGDLAPTRNIILQTEFASGIIPTGKGGDFTEQEAVAIAKQKGRDEAVTQMVYNFTDPALGRNLKTMPQIWYCADRDHARHVEKLLNDLHGKDSKSGTYAKMMHGDMKPDERKQIFDDYKAGRIKALISADLLIEGYDFPKCELTVMLRPTKSPRICVQGGARSTSTDPDNPDKIAYVINVADRDAQNYAIFGDIVNGLWVAPDHLWDRFKDVDYTSVPHEKDELPDVAPIRAICSEREWIDFVARRADGARVTDRLPDGYMQYTDIFRHYQGYVKFKEKIYALFQDMETQYVNAQLELPKQEQFRSILHTKQGIDALMMNNALGGRTLCFNAEQMHHFIRNVIMPERPLDGLKEGYIFLPDLLNDYYIPEGKRSAVAAFESKLSTSYHNAEKDKDINERYREPVSLAFGFNAIKARQKHTHLISVEEEPARRVLEKSLGLERKAPPLREGFVSEMQLMRRLQSERYLVSPVELSQLFAGWVREIKGKKSDDAFSPLITRDGVEVAWARSPSGRNMPSIRFDGSPKRRITGAVEAVKQHLGLITQDELLPRPSENYIPFFRIEEMLNRVFADASEPLAELENRLQNRYKKTVEHHGMKIEGDSLPKVKLRLKKGDDPNAELRVTMGGVGIRNAVCLHKSDIAKLPQLLSLDYRYLEPPAAGYVSYHDAIDLLQQSKLKAHDTFHYLLQVLELEYEQAQDKLPVHKRYREPFTSEDGVTLMRCSGAEGDAMFFDKESLMNNAHRILGVEQSSEAKLKSAHASHRARVEQRHAGFAAAVKAVPNTLKSSNEKGG